MGVRGPLPSRELKLGPSFTVVGPDDAPPESAARLTKPLSPQKPDTLPTSLEGMWDEITTALSDAGMIAQCDGATLELALRHYAAAQKASDALMSGEVTEDDKKNARVMKNPASQVFRDHSLAFLEFAKQLGLTFVSRARTVVSDGVGSDSGNPFA